MVAIKLKHYYHIFSNGLWQLPFDEHLRALTDSGLLDVLDFIGVGIVGADANRAHVKKLLPSKFHVVAEAGIGFEQVTHTALAADLQEPAKILYCHTKGSANHRHDQDTWRREMTLGTVYHWRECVDLLDQYDAVGCRWRRDPWRHFLEHSGGQPHLTYQPLLQFPMPIGMMLKRGLVRVVREEPTQKSTRPNGISTSRRTRLVEPLSAREQNLVTLIQI